MIWVEVVYARPDRQELLQVEIQDGATIRQVIQVSGILELFPEIELDQVKVGVFSKAKKLTDLVRMGDRVEIYRGLVIDPMEARRKRVKGKK